MTRFEYKTVAAPRKERRFKGVKSGAEGFARTIEDVLNEECVDGWEFQRAESLPCDARGGLFSRGGEVLHTVLIFRRALPDPHARPELSPHHQPVIRASKKPEPKGAPGATPLHAPQPVASQPVASQPQRPAPAPAPSSEPTSLFALDDRPGA